MLKNLNMSAKLVAVLLAPVLVLVALAVVGIGERQAEADEASAATRLTQLASASNTLSHELQLEAILSATAMASEGLNAEVLDQLEAQRIQTDSAAEAFEAAAAGALVDEESDAGTQLLSRIESAQVRIVGLNVARKSVDDTQVDITVARSNFAESTQALLQVSAEIASNTKNPQLANQLRDLVLLNGYKATQARIDALLAGATATGLLSVEDRNELTTDEANQESLLEALFRRREFIDEFATAVNKALLRNTASPAELENVIKASLETPVGQRLATTNAEWRDLATTNLENIFKVENSIVIETLDIAESLRSDAEGERNLFVLGTLLAVAFALFIALLVSRATTRPLRQLTDAAYELSNEKLPSLVDQLRNPQATGDGGQVKLALDAIDIDSHDEVGRLAEAFNAIQRVTIDVAEEQASLLRKGIGDIFINLARRNQNILDRQIEFIDMLEAKEEDPDQLDNLFKLDHLATRMRRNAESLLVLAGAEPPRRRGRPVELADVIRVAIGEVEDFARIGLVALDDVAVDGNVAVDLAHLLSEFMENATHFSPPDTQVEVLGRWGRNSDGDAVYNIMITDQGIGMSAEQMAEANHLLAHPPLVGLALSRSLGFIVIGRLAQRLGLNVALESAPTGGVVANIALPAGMVKVEGQEEPSLVDDVATGTDETALNIEPYEPVAYEPPPVVEAPPEYEAPPAYEPTTSYDDTGTIPRRRPPAAPPEPTPEPEFQDFSSDDDFDRGLADLLGDDVTERPVEEPPAAPAGLPTRGKEASREVPEERPESEAESLASLPTREVAPEAPAPVAEAQPAGSGAAVTTSAGLVRRTPKEKKEGAGTQAIGGGGLPTAGGGSRSTAATQRSPEEVRKMLSRYRAGVRKDTSAVEATGDSE